LLLAPVRAHRRGCARKADDLSVTAPLLLSVDAQVQEQQRDVSWCRSRVAEARRNELQRQEKKSPAAFHDRRGKSQTLAVLRARASPAE
jgi:hypothetical protein